MPSRWRSVCIVVTPGSGEGRARGVARRLGRLLRRRGSAVTTQAFDTLPSLGVVILSLGVLLGDIVIAGGGVGIGVLGVVVVIGLGKAITKLF